MAKAVGKINIIKTAKRLGSSVGKSNEQSPYELNDVT